MATNNIEYKEIKNEILDIFKMDIGKLYLCKTDEKELVVIGRISDYRLICFFDKKDYFKMIEPGQNPTSEFKIIKVINEVNFK